MSRAAWISIVVVAVIIVAAVTLSTLQSTGVNRDNPTPVSGNAD